MTIDREGNLILSCPNFANMDLPEETKKKVFAGNLERVLGL